MSVTTYFRINNKRAKAILAEVEGAVGEWRDEARALGMTADDLGAFADAFEHKERAAAQRVAQ
jgi:serine/threonine-protein kinase HipA